MSRRPKPSLAEHERALLEALEAAGQPYDGKLTPGVFHRYGHRKSSWLKVYHLSGGHLHATFGDFRSGTSLAYRSWQEDGEPIAGVDAAAIQRELEAAERQLEEREAKARGHAAKLAATIVANCPTTGTSEYLNSKEVAVYGLNFGVADQGPFVAVPMRDLLTGDLKSVQKIHADGSKRFLPGTPIKNNALCHLIGAQLEDIEQRTGEVWLAEGYATAATVHAATGEPVLVAFDGGNLGNVAKAARKRWPALRLAVAADNDQWKVGRPIDAEKPKGRKIGNTGVDAARKIAAAVTARVVVPDFTNLVDVEQCRAAGSGPTDFNDLQTLAGLDVVRRQLQQKPTAPANASTTDDGAKGLAARFKVLDQRQGEKNAGVWYQPPISKDGRDNQPIWICAPLHVTAATRNVDYEEHGHLLEFKDRHGVAHQWAMPLDLLEDRRDYRRVLRRLGLTMNSSDKGKELLQLYLDVSHAQARALCVDRIGWHGASYVLPQETIGTDQAERVLLQTHDHRHEGYRAAGDLEGWQRSIAQPCVGNSRLILAVASAFAAPVLTPAEAEGGGIHYRGDSSSGKTTALIVAGSVWGEPGRLERWRATDNGLEGVALLHNDNLLCLDEIKEVDPRLAGQIAYMLANGAGKRRSQPQGGTRRRITWRLLFLSSGELSLEQHVREAGQRTFAGQEVRLIDIPADAGAGLGLFENLHGVDGGKLFADQLKLAAGTHYGHAGQVFLTEFIAHRAEALEAITAAREEFAQTLVPVGASGQVERVADRFGLIAAAGELATKFGVTGWAPGDALHGVRECFAAWLENRGGIGSSQESRALAQVQHFFESHGSARFVPWHSLDGECEKCNGSGRVEIGFGGEGRCFDCNGTGRIDARPVINRAGFRRENGAGVEFYVFGEVFRKEVASGFDSAWLARLLLSRGLIEPDNQGKATRPEKLPGSQGKTIRVYRFRAEIIGTSDD